MLCKSMGVLRRPMGSSKSGGFMDILQDNQKFPRSRRHSGVLDTILSTDQSLRASERIGASGIGDAINVARDFATKFGTQRKAEQGSANLNSSARISHQLLLGPCLD